MLLLFFQVVAFQASPIFQFLVHLTLLWGRTLKVFFSGACKAYQTGGIKSRHGKMAIKVISRKFFNSRVFFMHREPGHP